VKTKLAIAAAGLLALVALFGLVMDLPLGEASSSSQIFIHGTPVCVVRQGKRIVATVGECGAGGSLPDAGSREAVPFHRWSAPVLPPGHPPVGRGLVPDGNRLLQI